MMAPVAAERWKDFIEWARRARAKPTFDREERDYRLAVAAAVRDLTEAARDGLPLAERIAAVGERARASREVILPPRVFGELRAWVDSEPARAARALRPFASLAADPAARLERFMAEVVRDPQADLSHDGAQVGALLNFGASPERVPVAHPARYALVRHLLGEDAAQSATPLERYRGSLAFAAAVEAALREAGVPVRDMIDVDSLITICGAQAELWAGSGEEADSRRTADPEVYLAVCMIYRNEADYLREWIEFHRLVGVERFYLYDNESDDDHVAVLAPYVEEGLVVPHRWPGSSTTGAELNAIQKAAYEDCVSRHAEEARWIAVFDADEFLFSPTGRPVSELLAHYERWPAVAVNALRFGSADEPARAGGLVIERHTRLDDTWGGRLVKSVLDPCAVTRCINSHRFEPRRGATVDENGYPVFHHTTRSSSHARLQINHYLVRSDVELREKHARRVTDRPGYSGVVRKGAPQADERDEAILQYLPALRDALSRRAADGGRDVSTAKAASER
jgi:hypothetical protein